MFFVKRTAQFRCKAIFDKCFRCLERNFHELYYAVDNHYYYYYYYY